jgi:hypothetical protein
MSKEHATLGEMISGALEANARRGEGARGGGQFVATCIDKDGNVKWQTPLSPNLVVNVGLKDMNDKYFSGVTYTAAWLLGLYGAAASNNPASGDTAASHAGWTEFVNYSQATRPACTFGAATTADPSVISNSASPAAFSINGAGGTVGGAFLISNSTKSGTTGILFSAADFQTPGDRSVVNGDTINVTYQFSLDAA